VLWIDKEKNDELFYRPKGCTGWKTAKAISTSLEGYNFHKLTLSGLQPDSTTEFKIDEKVYCFHTLPKTMSRPIRFVVGGDMYHDSLAPLKETNCAAARTNPDFALVGGDIAYAASKYSYGREDMNRWMEWVSAWTDTMITPEGHLIPMMAAIGNHDVNGRYLQTPAQAKMFYTLFSKGYQAITFGNYLSIIILDSGHTHPIAGQQTAWLKKTLEEIKTPYTFALYHVPAYPSVRKMKAKMCPEVRTNWSPLFEAHKITAAFEHHDHTYKRTHPMKGGKMDPTGIIYLGDGGWGVDKARIPRRASFLAKTAPERHFIAVTINEKMAEVSAINSCGVTFDHFFLPSK
jgi:hypothetical protein